MGCKIESIGIKYPEKQVTTSEILARLNVARAPKLELLTGIKSRKVCSDVDDSLSLAVDAVNDCLRHSQYRAEDIQMVIYCAITKYVNGLDHHYEPALSCMIKQSIGNDHALNFDLSNACAGMLTGAHVATDFIERGVVENCLVVSGEYITSISDNAEQNINATQHNEVASLTVGDAGAAVIFSKTDSLQESIAVIDMVTISKFSHLCMGEQASNQPGGSMRTQMQEIHSASIENAPYFVGRSLKAAGLSMKDIDYLIPHQTAKQSIQSGAKSLAKYFGEKPGQVVVNLETTGNTASTTHFATLYKYLTSHSFKDGDTIMLLSFGSGLVIGTMIFSFHSILENYGQHN